MPSKGATIAAIVKKWCAVYFRAERAPNIVLRLAAMEGMESSDRKLAELTECLRDTRDCIRRIHEHIGRTKQDNCLVCRLLARAEALLKEETPHAEAGK